MQTCLRFKLTNVFNSPPHSLQKLFKWIQSKTNYPTKSFYELINPLSILDSNAVTPTYNSTRHWPQSCGSSGFLPTKDKFWQNSDFLNLFKFPHGAERNVVNECARLFCANVERSLQLILTAQVITPVKAICVFTDKLNHRHHCDQISFGTSLEYWVNCPQRCLWNNLSQQS